MAEDLEAIFNSDRDPLATVRYSFSKWAANQPSVEKAIKLFTDYVAKNMRAKTWGHSPRKAFLIFSIASDDACKATASVKEASWESYFTYFIKVVTKSSPVVGDSAAAIEEEDIEHCLIVSTELRVINYIAIGYRNLYISITIFMADINQFYHTHYSSSFLLGDRILEKKKLLRCKSYQRMGSLC